MAPADDFFNMEIGPPRDAQGGRKSENVANFANWSAGQLPSVGQRTVSWTKGDRVLALWEPEWYYPGTVGEVDGDGLFVFFDDGARCWIPAAAVRPLDVQPGSRIHCRFRAGTLYYPATVENRNGDQLFVRYEQGGIEWSVIAHIRVAAAPWAVPPTAALANRGPERGEFHERSLESAGRGPGWDGPRSWSVGERVLAPLGDGWLYPGVVAEMRGSEILVWFDSGTKNWLDGAAVRVFDITVGSRVFCRWMGGAVYYGGRIKEHAGDRIFIHYDDGDQEWNVIGLIRVPASTSAAFFGHVQSVAHGPYGCMIWMGLIVLVIILVSIFGK